jgi:hypothetical protein
VSGEKISSDARMDRIFRLFSLISVLKVISYANWGILAAYMVKEPYEVAIVGKMAESYRREMDNHYLPDVLMLGGKGEGSFELLKDKLVKGQTTIYVCQDKICNLPVRSVQQALQQIKK